MFILYYNDFFLFPKGERHLFLHKSKLIFRGFYQAPYAALAAVHIDDLRERKWLNHSSIYSL